MSYIIKKSNLFFSRLNNRYRGKTEDNRFVYGDSLLFDDAGTAYIVVNHTATTATNMCYWKIYKIKPNTYGERAPERDSFNRFLYQDDIVRANIGKNQNVIILGVVLFADGEWGIKRIGGTEFFTFRNLNSRNTDLFEIAGNIYDNPISIRNYIGGNNVHSC